MHTSKATRRYQNQTYQCHYSNYNWTAFTQWDWRKCSRYLNAKPLYCAAILYVLTDNDRTSVNFNFPSFYPVIYWVCYCVWYAKAALPNKNTYKCFLQIFYLLSPCWWPRKGQSTSYITTVCHGHITKLTLRAFCGTHLYTSCMENMENIKMEVLHLIRKKSI